MTGYEFILISLCYMKLKGLRNIILKCITAYVGRQHTRPKTDPKPPLGPVDVVVVGLQDDMPGSWSPPRTSASQRTRARGLKPLRHVKAARHRRGGGGKTEMRPSPRRGV